MSPSLEIIFKLGKERKLELYPSKSLVSKAIEVVHFDDQLKQLVLDMYKTMYLGMGCGLAAPQIGISQRIMVIDPDYNLNKLKDKGPKNWSIDSISPYVFINPVLTLKGKKILKDEGCLSFPGVYEKVKRAEKVFCRYQDINGDDKTLMAEGLLAHAMQHELDHLDGITLFDRVMANRRNYIKKIKDSFPETREKVLENKIQI